MNEAMRLLGRMLRPIGYDVRPSDAFNLLPARGATEGPVATVRAAFDRGSRPLPLADGKMGSNTLSIIFRTCLKPERLAKAELRLGSIPISQIVERCLRSLVASVNLALELEANLIINFTVLDDRSDPGFVRMYESMTSHLRCNHRIVPTSIPGQGESLHEQFSTAAEGDGLYYFCEDDYLHNVRAIFEMHKFYNQIYESSSHHCLIFPQEHEELYSRSYHPCYLILSPYRHWRSASNATHVFMTHSSVVRGFWNFFEPTKHVGTGAKRRQGSERRTTNRILEHLPGFAPIPGLAGHLQAEHLLPPFFDWRAIWEANAADEWDVKRAPIDEAD